MNYTPPDKTLAEFTEEEREELIAELKREYTPEEWENLASFFRLFSQSTSDFRSWISNPQAGVTWAGIVDILESLRDEIESDPEAANLPFNELVASGKFDEAIERAAMRLERDNSPEVSITTRPITALDFPLDKINSSVWKAFEEKHIINGQLRMNIGVESEADSKAGKEVNIAYSIDFEELEKLGNLSISRHLEPYDKRVYIAVGAIYDSGQQSMTYQQIYNAMGYEGRAGARALKKIDEAVTKMGNAKIFIDNLQESQEYKSRTYFKYDGMLLPMERISAVVNGQLAESVVHIFRTLPMLEFARERGQFTTIEKKLLDSPLSKTNANIQLEDYLIDRISHMKNGKAKTRMLFATICERAGITTKKQKQRAWDKITKLLNYYVKCGFIAGYDRDEKGVTITL